MTTVVVQRNRVEQDQVLVRQGMVVTISSGAEVVEAEGRMEEELMEDMEDEMEGTEITILDGEELVSCSGREEEIFIC